MQNIHPVGFPEASFSFRSWHAVVSLGKLHLQDSSQLMNSHFPVTGFRVASFEDWQSSSPGVIAKTTDRPIATLPNNRSAAIAGIESDFPVAPAHLLVLQKKRNSLFCRGLDRELDPPMFARGQFEFHSLVEMAGCGRDDRD